MSFKKFDGSAWQPINPKKLKGIPYTGTLPAVLAGTKAGYLHRYKIYGNLEQTGTPTPSDPIYPSECGERTENWFDESNFALIQVTATAYRYGTSLGVLPQGTYIFNATKSSGAQSIYLTAKLNGVYSQTTISSVPFSFTADGVSEYIIRTANNTGTTWEAEKYSNIMLNSGSTPLPYEPYGYKLPLLSGSTPVDIYIGDDTLSTEEYVDSGTGKIYRMVSGTLTPTDPPVPFPQIPTTANSTTISWAGQGLAPSQFDSIQEWVDIPTYTRVNGEWVADN